MAKFGFDVTEVEPPAPRGEYEPIPEGNYILKALDAVEKKTAKGGVMITAKFEVVKGEHAGRLLWQNFNTVNVSDTAQTIGRQQLVAWATACGYPLENETDRLLGKSFAASVGISPPKGSFPASNNIKAFLAKQADGEAPARKAPPAPKPAAKSAPAGKDANPWD